MPKATIYPDTNAFFTDPLLRRRFSKNFLKVLSPGIVEVGLSPVVVAETERHTVAAAAEAVRVLRKALRAVEHEWDSDTSAAKVEVEELASRVIGEGAEPLAALLAHKATRILRWSRVAAKDLVQRELDGRRPTKLQGDQTTGLRDTVIWHTILDDLDLEDPNSIAIVVTKDGGFLNAAKDHLHQDLLDDLEELVDEPERVIYQPDLAGATLEAQKFAKLITEREAAIREEFLTHMRNLERVNWFGRVNARGDRADSDTYPAEAPHYLEEGQVVAVDIEDIESISNSDPSTVVGYAMITFEGSMPTYEYFSGQYDEVEWYDGEVEDHYLTVSLSMRVRVEAEIEVDMSNMAAMVSEARYEWV